MYLIGISGKANSGKNTLSKLLSEVLEEPGCEKEDVITYAFANPIKEMILTMFSGAKRQDLYGPSRLRENLIPGSFITYRAVLKDLGKLGRSYDKNLWIRKFEEHFEASKSIPCNLYIVEDVRFGNEMGALKKLNFTIIRIKRNTGRNDADESETSLDDIPDDAFDHVIDNDGSLEHLKLICKKIASKLKR